MVDVLILRDLEWWKKPLDIKQPVVVREDRMRRLLAYMWMASKASCIPKPISGSNETIEVGRDPEFEAIIDDRASSAGVAAGDVGTNARQAASNSLQPAADIPNTDGPSETAPSAVTVTVTETRALPGTAFRVNPTSTRWKVTKTWGTGEGHHAKVHTYTHYKPAVFNLTSCDVRRWQLAREAMDQYRLKKPDKDLDLVTIKAVPELMGLDDTGTGGFSWASLGLTLGFSLVAAGYGGLHALAWNARFPTRRELKLWRISALVIASPAVLCIVLILLSYAGVLAVHISHFCLRKIARVPKPDPRGTSPPEAAAVGAMSSSQSSTGDGKLIVSVFEFFGTLAGTAFYLLYLLARGYLVYESFRTVFFLPPAAYRVPSWTQYLPHIT